MDHFPVPLWVRPMKYLAFSLCLLFSGCSLFEKDPPPPLEGKRISVDLVENTVSLCTPFNESFLSARPCPPSWQWNQPGGTAHHVPGPFYGKSQKGLQLQWKVLLSDHSSPKTTAPIAWSQGFLVLTPEKKLYDINLQGEKRLISSLQDPLLSLFKGGMATDDQRVFITLPEGVLIALDRESGKLQWKRTLPSPSRNGPSLSKEGILAVLSMNNHLTVLQAQTGKLLWNHEGVSEETTLLGGSSPAFGKDKLISAFSSGEVAAFSLRDGTVAWIQSGSLLKNASESLPHIQALPLVMDGKIYTLSYNGPLSCFDVDTGNLQWSEPLGGTQTPFLVGKILFFLSHNETLVALHKDTGKVIWTKKLEGEKWMGPLFISPYLYLLNAQGKIVVLDPRKSGKLVSSYEIKEPCSTAPIAAHHGLAVLSQKGTLFFFSF